MGKVTPMGVLKKKIYSLTPKIFSEDLKKAIAYACLLYTSDAADDLLCVDLGGRRIIKKTQ